MTSPNYTDLSRRNLLHVLSLLGLTAFGRGTLSASTLRTDDTGATRRFLIDTDTASDDAVALVMALRNPGVSVEAITVVAGNMPIEKGLQNALYTRDLCQSHAPVYRGSAAPLLRPLHTAEYVHGNDGFGDIGLPLTGRTPAPGHAVPAIIDVINRHAGEITLVTLGPLTNIALALKLDPSIAQKVTRCVIMGGVGFGGVGNVTPVAEYNIWEDPEAAKIVFESGLPIEMVGWDISVESAVFDPQETARLRDIGTPLAKFCVDIQKSLTQFALTRTKLAGFDLPDPIAMAVAIDPSIATKTERRYVQIDTQSDLTLGQTVVDQLGVTGKPANTTVVKEASRERFIQLLHDSVRA